MSGTKIWTDINFDKNGRQTSFLRLPHSIHSSAYGYIPIPITVIRNGAGPTVLLSAGNHGDEYEGQVTLMNLVRKLTAKMVKGRIIILSSANFPAAMAGMRTSPIDEGNLNRSFPGDANGRPTMAIAHYIESVLLPMSDYSVDLHSGGSSLMYIASSLARAYDDKEKTAKSLEMMRIFGAPVGYVISTPIGGGRTLSDGADRCGVQHLGTELGGGGTVTPSILRYAEAGVARLLHHFGVLQEPLTTEKPGKTRLMSVGGHDYYVYTPEDGLYEPLVELGDEVKKGQPAAKIHFQHTPWRTPAIAEFEHDGVVICKRVPGKTVRGDCLFHLGTDYAG